MGYLTVHVKMNDWGLSAKLASAAKRAEHAVAVAAMRMTDPYVPARNKSLANRSQVKSVSFGDGDELPPLHKRRYVKDNLIVYPGPYARFLYYGKLMIDPETGSAWAKKNANKVVTEKDLDIKQTVNPKAQAHWFEASKAENLEAWKKEAAEVLKRFDR